MRAKTINEYKFERNLEPKKAMGTGILKEPKFSYKPTNSPGEYEIIVNFGKIAEDDVWYVYTEDESWEEIEKTEKTKLKRILRDLKKLLKEAYVTHGGDVLNPDIINPIKQKLEECNFTELFGAETYNGWSYEDLMANENLTFEQAVISTAVYAIVKCYVFFDIIK